MGPKAVLQTKALLLVEWPSQFRSATRPKSTSGEIITAENIMSRCYDDSDDEDENYSDEYRASVIALKALIAGVRKHGTYKKYMRAPHRDVLAVRGLAQRGKLRTDHPALAFLAKRGDNGVVWHILSYWRPDN